MKKLIYLISTILLIASCNDNDLEKGSLIIHGDIKGLKEGKVLLQKIQDSVMVTIDSVALDGISTFSLKAQIEEPQLMYLHLDLKDGNKYDDRAMIFVEDTVLTLTAQLEDFENTVEVSGSKNHDIWSKFRKNLKGLNERQTALVKRSMELSKQENPSQASIDSLNIVYEKYLRKRILYAINYALLHKDKEVAPYVLLSEGFDANPVLLDSVYQQMPKKIQNSYNGVQLSELIENSKKALEL